MGPIVEIMGQRCKDRADNATSENGGFFCATKNKAFQPINPILTDLIK